MFIKRAYNSLKVLAFIIAFLFCLNFHGNRHAYAFEFSEDKEYEVFVIQDFWHTGIVFNVQDVDSGIWPEIKNYRQHNFVDTGWGDEKFYQAEGNPLFLGARAMLWPTSSVLQVYAFRTGLRAAYGNKSRILRIPVTGEQLNNLTRYVSENYLRDENNRAIPSSLHGESAHYFLARGRYHIFQTCNTWVAKAFRQSGFELRTFMILNANALYRELSILPGAEFIE